MEQIKIAPGVVFKKGEGQCRLVILDSDNPKLELIAWDFEKISTDPDEWISSLQAVSLATQHGPSIAKMWVEKKREKINTPYGSLLCNMCGEKFAVQLNHPYSFIMDLSDKSYHDYQCSEECNKKRYEQVYNDEMGVDFMKFLGKLKPSETHTPNL